LLLGKTESESIDDPWPITLPGEEKPISSSKIGGYINEDFGYYYQFYTKTKHAGAPLSGGWTEWPAWIPQLISYFDNAIEAVKIHNEREAYKGIKHGRS